MKLDPITKFILSEQRESFEIKKVNDLYNDKRQWDKLKNDFESIWKRLTDEDNEYAKATKDKSKNTPNVFYNILQLSNVYALFINEKLNGIIFITERFDRLNKKFGFLTHFFIEPEYRGKGYGTLLLKKVFDHCKKADCKYIDLNVWEENKGAQKLYSKHGFKNQYIHMIKFI